MSSSSELHALRERAKELRCLYRVSEVLSNREDPPHQVFRRVLEAIPDGWQFPEETSARITYLGRSYATPRFAPSPHTLRAPLAVWQTEVGAIDVVYGEVGVPPGKDPFLSEERELLATIAARLGEYLEWKHQELVGERIGAADEHWRWRQRYAERIALRLGATRFDVEKVYLTGSPEAGNAGPGSDIDLTIVFRGDPAERRELEQWLEGWSLCLAEIAFEHTGYPMQRGLLDVRLVTELAPTDLAAYSMRELPLGR